MRKDIRIIPRRFGEGRTQMPRNRPKEPGHKVLRRHNPIVGIMKEIADIATQHPDWGVRFTDSESEVKIEVVFPADDAMSAGKQFIMDKVRATYAKYNKVPGQPELADALRLTFAVRKKPD
jgi:hypothetical protein